MPVHLTGRMCEMDRIMRIAKKNIKVIEDCAQSIGSIFNKKKWFFRYWGLFNTSTEKFKCLGDGGFIITNNKKNF